MASNRNRPMSNGDTFDVLYEMLATAWESHQALRRAQAPITELALSNVQLDMARSSMWAWWKENRIEVN